MTSVAIASVADAPGATTLAVGLVSTWPITSEPAVLVEADPDGGRLGSRLGVGVEPGLMSLALASRTSPLQVVDVVASRRRRSARRCSSRRPRRRSRPSRRSSTARRGWLR